MSDADDRRKNGLNEQDKARRVLDAYAQGDAGDRLALFLGYRDLRLTFRAVDLDGADPSLTDHHISQS